MEKLLEKTLGELESEISNAIIRFEKEFMGRGPLHAKTYILDGMVVVRLKGVLTQAEVKLAEARDKQRGRYLLKQVRQELLDSGRPVLDSIIREVLGVSVRSMHTDISTKTGERVIIFTLDLGKVERGADLAEESVNNKARDTGKNRKRPERKTVAAGYAEAQE